MNADIDGAKGVTLGAIAAQYAERGWPVFPLVPNGKTPATPHGFKDATTDLAQVEDWWTASPLANIGVATGEASGIVVLDVDAPNGAHKHDGAKALAEAGIVLPDTAVAETPNGGRHYYFKAQGAKSKSKANITVGGQALMGVDVRAEGGYIVAVGSVIDGRPYKWIYDADLADIPEELKQVDEPKPPQPDQPPSPLANSQDAARRASAYLATMPEAISGQGGHNALMSAAGALVVGFRLDDETAFRLLWDEYNPRCKPPWTEKEIRHKLTDARKNPPRQWGELLEAEASTSTALARTGAEAKLRKSAKGGTAAEHSRRLDKWRPNDVANTDLLLEILGEDFKFDATRGKHGTFRHFDGVYWRPVENGEAALYDAIRLVPARRMEEAARCLREAAQCGENEKEKASALRDRAEAQIKYAGQAEKWPAIVAMRKLLPTCEGVTPSTDEWNNGIADLLPVANGLVNLKTGELLPPDRERLITSGSHLRYNPEATSERWATFLDEATGGDADLLAYLQLAAGYSATGRTDEQCLFVLQGEGETGKSLFLKSIANAVGMTDGLGRTIDPALFCKRALGERQPANVIADLAGFRLVVGAETAAGDALDEEIVKQITGESKMNGKLLYRDSFQFTPVCKLWIATNHALHWNANDVAMSRRVVEIPFNHRPAVRDTSLARLFSTSREDGGDGSAEAILNWLVKGAMRWYAHGDLRARPEACMILREQSEAERDFIGAFISAKICVDLVGVVLRSEVNRVFEQFCTSNGRVCNALAKRQLLERLGSLHVEEGNTHGSLTLRGMRIKA